MSRWAWLMFDCEFASVGCAAVKADGQLFEEGGEGKRGEECV